MKRSIILLFVCACLCFQVQAQWDNGLGHFTEEEIRERDAIATAPRHNYNDNSDDYVKSLQLYQKVSAAVNQAQGRNGIQIERTPSYNQSSANRPKSTYQQQQQMKKAQYDANHSAWLEQRRAQKALEAEQARVRREKEKQRIQEEKQRRYDEGRNRDLQISSGHYQRQHDQVTYNVTEGYARTMNYQPEGSQQLQSHYIPTSNASSNNLVVAIGDSYLTKPISLSAVHIQYTNYEKEWLKCMKRIDLPKEREYPSKDGKIWDKMRNTLDETQIQGIAYAMKSTNVRNVVTFDVEGNIITEKEGVLPTAMGINNKGNYVFESVSDPDLDKKEHFDRIYEVTPNGTLTYIALDEHFFDDENIIKMVREGRFVDELKHSVDVKFEGGSISLKDLKDATPEKVRNLLPEIKAEFKMNLFDNSTTAQGKIMHFFPESNIVNNVIKMNDPAHSSYSIGGGGEFSGGPKGEIRIGYGTNKWFTKPNEKQSKEEKGKHWLPDMKAGITTAEAQAYFEMGQIKKVGNQFIQCNGTVGAKGSTELDYITATTLNPFRGNATVGWSCKIITTPESQIPTERK